ncbi:cell division protein FtsQ/DivIB [Desulfoferrobacter suflitae]|uniref:cell division protein FtsQ/DivIB n=1 Tax=Desulfoferrobacter suflitae TaxID=2865782 RepID=UPI002164D88B|nr:cell division protein FtsQ/DivIB [Desulfoferrobacter suflitae]MCK8600406.1 cell division protein FtsQ/DivIB [Desulfoferrobacter suflitae]
MGKKINRYKTGRTGQKKFLRNLCGRLLGLSLVIFGLPLLSAALAHAYYALLDAAWPQVQEIEIINTRRMERGEVLNTMGVPKGANLFSVRATHLSSRLESLPWVRSAVVRIDLSGKMVVDISEREPLAIVHITDFFLLDREGKLFLQTQPLEYPDLLLVTGMTANDIDSGKQLKEIKLQILRDLLQALEKVRNWFPPRQISQCHWQEGAGIILYTTRGGIPIRLGLRDFDGKLARLNRVFAVLMDRACLDAVKRIDLDYPNRAYIEGNFASAKGI